MMLPDNRCKIHREKYKDNNIMSPCRHICKLCKKKRVNGYSNPDHISNPFGYLFLFPVICDGCSTDKCLCKWCDIVDCDWYWYWDVITRYAIIITVLVLLFACVFPTNR